MFRSSFLPVFWFLAATATLIHYQRNYESGGAMYFNGFVAGVQVSIGLAVGLVFRILRRVEDMLISDRCGDHEFPRTDDVIVSLKASEIYIQVSPEDANFLAEASSRLPCPPDDTAQPITIDLGEQAVIRARNGSGPPTELVLSGSTVVGQPVRMASDRNFLDRAVRLGCRRLHFFGKEGQVQARVGSGSKGWGRGDRTDEKFHSLLLLVAEKFIACRLQLRISAAIMGFGWARRVTSGARGRHCGCGFRKSRLFPPSRREETGARLHPIGC